jgi:hypothetical protein
MGEGVGKWVWMEVGCVVGVVGGVWNCDQGSAAPLIVLRIRCR